MISSIRAAVDPVAWYQFITNKTLDPWQVSALNQKSKRLCLNISRQAGKTEFMVAYLAHTCAYTPNALCLALSPSLRQSGELFRRVHDLLVTAGETFTEETKTSLTLKGTKSRLVSLPGTEGTIRGFAGITIIALDEMARIPPGLFESVLPMLSVSDGAIICASTPFGPSGSFYEVWQDPTWTRIKVTADECPRIKPEWLLAERSRMGLFFEQEFYCQFLASDSSVFSLADVTAMFGEPDYSYVAPAPITKTRSSGIRVSMIGRQI